MFSILSWILKEALPWTGYSSLDLVWKHPISPSMPPSSIMLGSGLEDQHNARNFFMILDEMVLADGHIAYDVSHMSVSSTPVC